MWTRAGPRQSSDQDLMFHKTPDLQVSTKTDGTLQKSHYEDPRVRPAVLDSRPSSGVSEDQKRQMSCDQLMMNHSASCENLTCLRLHVQD